MSKRIEVVYENGVLRPLEPLELRDHQRVSIVMSDDVTSPADEDWLQQTERFAAEQPRAVHDALRFAPVPALPLQDLADHVTALLVRARRKPALLVLAVRLAGERDVTSLKAALESMTSPDAPNVLHFGQLRVDLQSG